MTHYDNDANNGMSCIAPYAPVVCAKRLQNFVTTNKFPFQRTRIKITRLRDDSFKFVITQSEYALPSTRHVRWKGRFRTTRTNYTKVRITGYLTHWSDNQSTIVSGELETLLRTYWVNGMVLLVYALFVLLVVLALPYEISLCVGPILVLGLISFSFTAVFQPERIAQIRGERLLRDIQQILQ